MIKKNGKTAAASSAPSAMPLFFIDPHPLDAARHGKAAVRASSDYAFARHVNSLPINAIEFLEASKHYPIVFTSGENPLPAVITGFGPENYFVNNNGWAPDRYIPAYVRQYPFVFMERTEEKKFYLCIDEAAAQYSPKVAKGAMALYDGKGKPSSITNNALEFCKAFYNHHMLTRNFCADLQKYKLLAPYQSEARLSSGHKLNLSGFQIIDEKVLNALPEKEFLELRAKNWLPFIYLALGAASNWKHLVNLAAARKAA